MKRGGRQQGMVRSYRILPSPLNPRPNTRPVNSFGSPPTAGLFTKVSSKPTNHSKFTGKCATPRCAACHVRPACKSRDKTKGAHKLRSCDVVSNARLATWRVFDPRPGFNLPGLSAARMLDRLSLDYSEDEGDDEVEVEDDPVSINDSYSFADLFRNGDDLENGFCEGDWVSETLISEMGLQMEHIYQVEEDGDWYFVESCS